MIAFQKFLLSKLGRLLTGKKIVIDERLLPPEILSKANLAGNEYAWPVDEIPSVIEAARLAGLISIGGQLQFRLPDDGGTCECYWVEVDTYRFVPKSLAWDERVEKTADIALEDFEQLRETVDFIEEGRSGFQKYLNEYEAQGGDLSDVMYFVWYVSADRE